MNSYKKRSVVYSIFLLLVLGWWYAASLDWRAENESERILSHEVSTESYRQIWLSAETHRMAAERLLVSDDPDYSYVQRLLRKSVALRPLYAPYLLVLAESSVQAGNYGGAKQQIERAVHLWPTRAVLLWKAAMLYVRVNDASAALYTLRAYLRSDPDGYEQALMIGNRIEPDTGVMVDAIVPAGFKENDVRDEFIWHVVRFAERQKNVDLATAAWHKLTDKGKRDISETPKYVEWLVSHESQTKALSIWRYFSKRSDVPVLENGGFEKKLLGGLDWREIGSSNVAETRDTKNPYEGRYSLKLTFPGDSNLAYYHIRQYLNVEPGAAYTLSFAWRGQNITTRSGPYVQICRQGESSLASSEERWGTWEWKEKNISFLVPLDTRVVEVCIRRNRTDALDNKISGILWLDDFTIERNVENP